MKDQAVKRESTDAVCIGTIEADTNSGDNQRDPKLPLLPQIRRMMNITKYSGWVVVRYV